MSDDRFYMLQSQNVTKGSGTEFPQKVTRMIKSLVHDVKKHVNPAQSFSVQNSLCSFQVKPAQYVKTFI